MELTAKDVLSLVTLLGSLGAVYVGLVVRLTRLEALVHRVETVEKAVDELQESGAALQADIASLRGGALRGRR